MGGGGVENSKGLPIFRLQHGISSAREREVLKKGWDGNSKNAYTGPETFNFNEG